MLLMRHFSGGSLERHRGIVTAPRSVSVIDQGGSRMDGNGLNRRQFRKISDPTTPGPPPPARRPPAAPGGAPPPTPPWSRGPPPPPPPPPRGPAAPAPEPIGKSQKG